MAAIVSIGRNITGVGPLADEPWAAFKSDLIDALAFTYASVIYFTGEGIGTFEGRSEQSFTVVFDERWPGNYSLEVLLKVLAARYGQESIALTRGETVLVEAGRCDHAYLESDATCNNCGRLMSDLYPNG